MKKRLRMGWAIASAVWVLLMLSMSFHDLKYGIEYRLFRDRIDTAHQEKLAAYAKSKQDGEEGIRSMLLAAKRYEQLQFLSLAAKRSARPSAISADGRSAGSSGEPQSEYERTVNEIAMLEATYGKSTLRKYRETDGQTEQNLHDELRARLVVPQVREPRLAAVLFHMIAAPLALLFALWIYEKGYLRLTLFRRHFGVK